VIGPAIDPDLPLWLLIIVVGCLVVAAARR
jgi:hypothetical protein